jgi:hypothetical protein
MSISMLCTSNRLVFADEIKGHKSITPIKLDRNVSLLDVKIGDTLDNVKNALKSQIPNQSIHEDKCLSVVDKKSYICHLDIFDKTKISPHGNLDTIGVFLTDPSSGNIVFAIKRHYEPTSGGNVSTENVITDLKNKFGAPGFFSGSPGYLSDTKNADRLFIKWLFDSNGKSYYNKDMRIDCASNTQDLGSFTRGCKGTTISVDVQSKEGMLLWSLDIAIKDHDLELASIENATMLAEKVHQEQLQQQQKEGSKNKVNF